MATTLIETPFNYYDYHNYTHDGCDYENEHKHNHNSELQINPIKIDIAKINQTINEFFFNKKEPITIEEMDIFKMIAQSLYPYYFVNENKSKYRYDLSISKNLADGYNISSVYVIDVTIYCDKKMILHVKFDDLEYTQYQISDSIIQLYKMENTIKIYNTKLNKYHSIEKQKTNRINQTKFNITNFIENSVNDIFNEKIIFSYDIYSDDVTYSLYQIDKIILLKSNKYSITIKNLNDNLKCYKIEISNKSKLLKYEIISSDLIQNVLPNILNLTFDKIINFYSTPNFNLNNFHNMKSEYIKIEMIVCGEIFIKKQIYNNDKLIIFDGISHLVQNSQMLIKFNFNGNIRENINNFMPFDPTNNKSVIFVNKIKENANNLKLQFPDFLIENDIDLIKQYIIKDYSEFNVKKLHKNDKTYILNTFKYNHNNKLISKITKSFELKLNNTLRNNLLNNTFLPYYEKGNEIGYHKYYIEQEMYNPLNDIIISKYTELSQFIDNNIQETISNIYANYNEYRIEYSKHLIGKIHDEHDKKIYKNNVLIYDGSILNDNKTINVNNMSYHDSKMFNYNNINNHNFISHFGFNLNNLQNNAKSDIQNNINKETLFTDDNKFKFEFSYTYYPNNSILTCGNSSSTAKNIIATQSENETENINSIDQHNFNVDGQQKNSKFIDESNRLVVKALSQSEINAGRIGYKAAKTIDGKMCIIKLFLPKDAKIAWDQYKDKYRTNKVIVLSIKKVYYEKKHYFYMKDFNLDECPICLDALATHMAYPCRHKLCGTCWKALIETSNNKNCHYCKSQVDKVEDVPINKLPNNCDINENEEILEAYSCVHTDQFMYKKDEQLIINDFDGNLTKTCAPGIHYHDNEKDVFQWFEYMDISENVLVDNIPWYDNYSKSYHTLSIPSLECKIIDNDNDDNFVISKGYADKNKTGKKKKHVSLLNKDIEDKDIEEKDIENKDIENKDIEDIEFDD